MDLVSSSLRVTVWVKASMRDKLTKDFLATKLVESNIFGAEVLDFTIADRPREDGKYGVEVYYRK